MYYSTSKRQRNIMTNMKEEQEIIKKCGKGNPFLVPDGYFEDFTRNLMAQLPQKDDFQEDLPELKITTWQRIKPLLYLAAMFIGMIMCVRVVLGEHTNNTTEDISSSVVAIVNLLPDYEQISDEDLASMVQYTMMDNYALYQYLSEIE